MDGFLSNTLANLVGTFAGAGLAVWTGRLAASQAERKRDRRLMQSVIDRLHWSRALRPHQDPTEGQEGTQWDLDDRKRCTDSVLATRERISTVKDELSGRAKESTELDAMLLACLGYLSRVEREPNEYVALLMKLQQSLAPLVDDLCAKDKHLRRKVVGGGDLANALELNRSA